MCRWYNISEQNRTGQDRHHTAVAADRLKAEGITKEGEDGIQLRQIVVSIYQMCLYLSIGAVKIESATQRRDSSALAANALQQESEVSKIFSTAHRTAFVLTLLLLVFSVHRAALVQWTAALDRRCRGEKRVEW
jgi:hypothetical protein